ncbi:MAG: helix-turn-helix domain-containing protein [Gemmatimonadales bacterium]
MATFAALLDRRPALLALRRALPRSTARVLTARNPVQLHRLLHNTLIDAIVIGADAARGAVLESLRRDYPGIPLHLMMPLRSDDADVLLRAHRNRVVALLVENLDEPVLGGLVRRHSVEARRSADLLPLATALRLTDRVQLEAWRVVVSDAPLGIDATTLARRMGIARETLSRRFASGGAPPVKRAIDAVRLVAAAQLLGNPAYRVEDAARLLGFSSASLLQRTARRTLGVAAREVVGIDAERLVARLRGADGAPDWT